MFLLRSAWQLALHDIWEFERISIARGRGLRYNNRTHLKITGQTRLTLGDSSTK